MQSGIAWAPYDWRFAQLVMAGRPVEGAAVLQRLSNISAEGARAIGCGSRNHTLNVALRWIDGSRKWVVRGR